MIANFMTEDHRKCDENFGYIEELIEGKVYDLADKEFKKWKLGMENHLDKEEKYLFLKAEEKFGGPVGPIMVMKMEHQQMRDIFSRMENAINEKDSNTFLGLAESCMILIQQHNMKEEQILYPMIDRALADQANEVIGNLQDGQFT